MIFFFHEKATAPKIIGISIALVGALVCILTQQSDDLASDAFTGNMLCLFSSVVYAVYLVASQRILSAVGPVTMLKYTFSGAAFSGIIVSLITGFDAPVLSMPFHWLPFAVLMFVLIFPTTLSYMLLPVGFEIFEDDSGCHLWLSDIDRGYHSFLDFGARTWFSWTQTFAILFICVGVYLVEVAESKDKAIPK